MVLIRIFALAAFAIALCSAHESCPDAASIKPCDCDSEGVNCMTATSIDQIKRAFQAKFPYGGIRGFWVQATNITKIPAGLFGTVKVQNIYIEVNKVNTVESGAFRGSESVLQTLSLFGNELESFPFGDLTTFTKLTVLNLAKNKLRSIPANAFSFNLNLQQVILAENQITSVGATAFSGPQFLGQINLMFNNLTRLGPYSLSTSSRHPMLEINLVYNGLSSIDDTAFFGTQPNVLYIGGNQLETLPLSVFQPMVSNMLMRPQSGIDLTGNPLRCCGSDFVWIIQNNVMYSRVLNNFQCKDGRSIQQLTSRDYNC